MPISVCFTPKAVCPVFTRGVLCLGSNAGLPMVVNYHLAWGREEGLWMGWSNPADH